MNVARSMVPELCRVLERRQETADCFSLVVEGRAFDPGQFAMLYAFGVGEAAISISGDPDTPRTSTFTIRRVGAVTDALAGLHPGDQIGVRGPFGRPWPIDQAKDRDIVVVAGGIGLAPLRPLVYEVLRRRDDFRRFVLLYGARTPDDLLFEGQLHEWSARFDMTVEVTVDHAPTRGASQWYGHVGVVPSLLPFVRVANPDSVAFVCGPEIMMRFTARELEKLGVPPAQVFVTMERNMKCGMGTCGHCQFGPHLLCRDGPVLALTEVSGLLGRREV